MVSRPGKITSYTELTMWSNDLCWLGSAPVTVHLYKFPDKPEYLFSDNLLIYVFFVEEYQALTPFKFYKNSYVLIRNLKM